MASKFTPEIRGGFLERIAAGLSIEDACRAVGIAKATFKGWQGRARKGVPAYVEFMQEVDDAREVAANRPEPMDGDELLRVVSQAARKGSVQAMKLRWEMICADRNASEEDETEAPASTRSRIDELAARRSAQAA